MCVHMCIYTYGFIYVCVCVRTFLCNIACSRNVVVYFAVLIAYLQSQTSTSMRCELIILMAYWNTFKYGWCGGCVCVCVCEVCILLTSFTTTYMHRRCLCNHWVCIYQYICVFLIYNIHMYYLNTYICSCCNQNVFRSKEISRKLSIE